MTSVWMRGAAVTVSAAAFAWVVVQAQGGCDAEPAESAPPAPKADGAEQAEAVPTQKPPVAPPTPESAPAVPASETPNAKPTEPSDGKKPAVHFGASRSEPFELDNAGSAGVGVGTVDPPKSAPADKSNNAGDKTKPKAFFPASKSGRVPESAQQQPNAPATK